MAIDASALFVAGETGLDITVSEADPVLREWRARFDPAAAIGLPPHVTVLYPFLPDDRIDDAVIANLAALFARHDVFDLDTPTNPTGVPPGAPATNHDSSSAGSA